MGRMGHASPTMALRDQHVMGGRDQAIAAALDQLAEGDHTRSGTDVAQQGKQRRSDDGAQSSELGRDGGFEPATPCSQSSAAPAACKALFVQVVGDRQWPY